MPEQVPDFVSELHQLIDQHVEEGLDNLGERISELTPGDADEQADDAEDGDSDGSDRADSDDSAESSDDSDDSEQGNADGDEHADRA